MDEECPVCGYVGPMLVDEPDDLGDSVSECPVCHAITTVSEEDSD